jgi:ABC-type phosphate transport system permease subunit
MIQTRIVLFLCILPLAAVVIWGLPGLGAVDFASWVWAPPSVYGVLGIAAGTALVSIVGGAVAGLLGEGVGLQIGLAGRSSFAVSLLAGTPGVLIAFALLAGGLGFLRSIGLGPGCLLAGLGLGLATMPLVAEGVAGEAASWRDTYLAALALGCSPDDAGRAIGQATRRATIRMSFAAAARIAGEAALVSVLVGGANSWPHLLAPSGSLAGTLLGELPQAPPQGRWVLALGGIALLLGLLGGLTGWLGRDSAHGL